MKRIGLFIGSILYCFLAFIIYAFNTNVSSTSKGTDEYKYIKKAQKSYQQLEFEKAGAFYQKALEVNPGSVAANFEMGLYQSQINGNHKKALTYFEVAEKSMTKDTVYELYYYLGTSHHLLGNYDKAIGYYTFFKKGLSTTSPGQNLNLMVEDKIAQCKFALNAPKAMFEAVAVNLGSAINTSHSEYSSVWIKADSTLVFNRRSKDNLGTYSFDNKYHEDMYVSTIHQGHFTEAKPIQENTKLNGLVNTKFHDAIVETSLNNDTLIIFKEKKLWYSIEQGGVLTAPQPFTRNINFTHYQRHACFSPDGKTIYFSSDDKGGKGGFDLYKATLAANGEWSNAVNLGDSINTGKDEDSPYLSPDGQLLFFASKGHPGYGGYDVFSSRVTENGFGKPVNVGQPINSPADDIYFSFEDKFQSQAYLSSSRVDGFGHMDIYKIKLAPTPPSYCITTDSFPHYAKIVLNARDTVAAGQSVELAASGEFKESTLTQITWHLHPGNDTLMGESVQYSFPKPGQYTATAKLKVVDNTYKTNWNYCATKNITVVRPEELANSGERVEIELENVYFDFDQSTIRKDADLALQRNVEKIKSISTITIKLVAHTDSKGSAEYNVKLSKKRAKSVARYLASKGLDVSKTFEIEWKGEDSPAAENTNADGSDNPEGRQKNRRVEFILVKK